MIFIEYGLDPVPMSRPRANYKTGRIYKELKDKKFQQVITTVTRFTYKRDPISGPLVLHLDFYLKKPKTVRRKYPEVRPDLDNLIKNILDGLNGVLFNDDSQIIGIYATKRYDKRGKITLQVSEI